MDNASNELISVFDIEIIPPERKDGSAAHVEPCLCCGCSCVTMDRDGCGICDECLAP